MIRKGRNYLIPSFVFSLCWHVGLLCAVGIVVMPKPAFQSTYTRVSFLGPILEKTAFEMMVEESRPKAETLYRTPFIIENEKRLDAEGPSRLGERDLFPNGPGLNQTVQTGGPVKPRKDITNPFIDKERLFRHIEERVLNRFIEGPAKERAVLYRPPEPRFVKRSFMHEDNFVTKLRFVLAGDGSVEFVEPVVSSGYPGIDIQCIRYLRQWKFMPSYEAGGGGDWGIIRIDVKVE